MIPKEEILNNRCNKYKFINFDGMEKNKTVIQKLLEIRYKSFDAMKFVKWFDENREELLREEKQQILEAFHTGDNSDCTSEQNAYEFAEQYYKDTYEK